ncbi:unnamed protein product [Prorocentrum cordatum]|uniref:EF-hand domain-containing protein n=1 Tax=Prorocentrum cordatum TaxID=2364126 RepID=A0ABN9QQD5_9DINO|nr:unnamed protein product [Polarella glacialis]
MRLWLFLKSRMRVPEKPSPGHDHHVPKPVYGIRDIVPVLTAPRTMQYNSANKPMQVFPAMPSKQLQCEGWGRAAIKNITDWLDKSFADKYVEGKGGTEWHYIQLDGWVIHFWNPEHWHPCAPDDREMLPVGWIDLRMVQAVETEMLHGRWNVDCPYEVRVLMRTGYMSFFVRKAEEAARWCEVIEAGFAEHQIAEEAKRTKMIESAKDIYTHTIDLGQVVTGAGGATHKRGKDGLLHMSIDPAREAVLRGLWVRCVRASAGQGGDLQDTFRQIFELYDFDGNGNLRMDELEIMVRELLAVRSPGRTRGRSRTRLCSRTAARCSTAPKRSARG